MTWPRLDSDLLMLLASRSRSPAAPDDFCRSLPDQAAAPSQGVSTPQVAETAQCSSMRQTQYLEQLLCNPGWACDA